MFEGNSCSHLSDNDLEGALKALEGQVEIDPREIAIIRYTPSVEDPHAKYADEVFYPPLRNPAQEQIREKILPPNAIDRNSIFQIYNELLIFYILVDLPDPYANYIVEKRSWIPPMRRRSSVMPDMVPIDPRNVDPPDALEFLQKYNNEDSVDEDDVNDIDPVVKFLNDMQLSPLEIQEILNPENRKKLDDLLRRFEHEISKSNTKNVFESSNELDEQPDERFTLKYNTPDNFRNGWESRDTLLDGNSDDFPESRVYFDEGDLSENDEDPEYGSGQLFNPDTEFLTSDEGKPIDSSEIFRELTRQMKNSGKEVQPAVYSEGGVVFSKPIDHIKGSTREEINPLISLDELLLNYNMGFKRPERLDVKKPGPPFDAQITDSSHKGKLRSM